MQPWCQQFLLIFLRTNVQIHVWDAIPYRAALLGQSRPLPCGSWRLRSRITIMSLWFRRWTWIVSCRYARSHEVRVWWAAQVSGHGPNELVQARLSQVDVQRTMSDGPRRPDWCQLLVLVFSETDFSYHCSEDNLWLCLARHSWCCWLYCTEPYHTHTKKPISTKEKYHTRTFKMVMCDFFLSYLLDL